MSAFRLGESPLDTSALRAELADPGSGGFAAFEGWVRDHNEGQRVTRLEYEAFAPLALREGERILAEARERFGVSGACVHRTGSVRLRSARFAVWVGAAAPHRDEAFRACRYIIDEIKHRCRSGRKSTTRTAIPAGSTASAVPRPRPHAGHDHAVASKA
jgi:molybdopterin synthase catalytic subunit